MGIWTDFGKFTQLAIESQDIDPVYPVLGHIARPYNEEARVWLVFLYLAFYNLSSALQTWHATDRSPIFPPRWCLDLPKATERRSHRNIPVLERHIWSYLDRIDAEGQNAWWREGWDQEYDAGPYRWFALYDRTQQIFGNGRWAAYKMGDLAHYVLGWNTPAVDLGIRYSSGPRHGLDLIFPAGVKPRKGNSDEVAYWYEQWGQQFYRKLRTQLGRKITIDRLETALCDFHSMAQGRYYVGHDIDQMQEQIGPRYTNEPMLTEEVREQIYLARWQALPRAYLGEEHDWFGVSKELRTLYRDTGRILTRPEWEEQR